MCDNATFVSSIAFMFGMVAGMFLPFYFGRKFFIRMGERTADRIYDENKETIDEIVEKVRTAVSTAPPD